MEKKGKRGVSRDQWLEAGLEALQDGGIHAVTIGSLAKKLGIARAGFYWHFKNRDELDQAMLDYWIREMTLVGTANEHVRELPAMQRLETLAKMILDYQLDRYELGIRLWALHDEIAAKAVKTVNHIRYETVSASFRELGFKGKDLEVRARLFFVYHSSERQVQRDVPEKNRRALIRRQVELLTTPSP